MVPTIRYSTRLHRILFPSVICVDGNTSVHLTFDDGPHPVATPPVLDALRSRSVRATFFLVGERIRRYPDIARRIADEGHRIENHGYTHQGYLFRSSKFIRNQVLRADEEIARITGRSSTMVRPPYGSFGPRAIRVVHALGKRLVLWTFDTRDFSMSRSERVVRPTVRTTRPGSIILLHDNTQTAPIVGQTIPLLIDRLLERGFSLTPLDL